MSQQQNISPPYSGFSQPSPTLNASTSFPVMSQVHTPDHSSSALPPSLRLSESWNRVPQGPVAVGPLFSTPISNVLNAGNPTDSLQSQASWWRWRRWWSLIVFLLFFPGAPVDSFTSGYTKAPSVYSSYKTSR